MRSSIPMTIEFLRPGSGVKRSEVYYKCRLLVGDTLIGFPTWQNMRNDVGALITHYFLR